MVFITVNDGMEITEFDDYEFQENNGYEGKFSLPYVQKESVNSLLPMQKLRKKGIVEECCHKPCSQENLLLYCGK